MALPVLAKHGIAVMQPTRAEKDVIYIDTILAHKSGQWISSEYPVCVIQPDHQKMGAALTYARRYGLSSLAGISSDEDVDGVNAGSPKDAVPDRTREDYYISAEQVKTLDRLLTETKSNRSVFLDVAKVRSLEDILSRDFDALVAKIEFKRARASAKSEPANA